MDQIKCIPINYKIYRLKDLQQIIDISKAPKTIQWIKPYKTNYTIESQYINGVVNHIITSVGCKSYKSYENLNLHLQLPLNKRTTYCEIQLLNKDIDIIDIWLKSN